MILFLMKFLIRYFFRLKDGTELEDSAKYRIKYHDGVAELFINGLEPEDAAEITCKATNNMGTVKTKADLTIEGKDIARHQGYKTFFMLNSAEHET